jgi:hypothetical protein
VNTLTRPHIPSGSEPTRDDDPTGVRALLSSLPEPDPMPTHLVERINASLAAEQAQRATTTSGAAATPMLATARRRRSRIMFAMAGAAAAAAIAVVGTTLFTAQQSNSSSGSAAIAGSAGRRDSLVAPPSAALDSPGPVAGAASTPTLVLIGLSQTRYTQSGFAAQARTLSSSAAAGSLPKAAQGSSLGPISTVPGLRECLDAIGASGAQVVRADIAFYEGQPAVIIVATTNGRPVAYAVGRQCSGTDAALLRPATSLS